MVVFKYIVPVPSPFMQDSAITMPKGAQILSVGAQGNDIVIWARVDPEAEKVHRIVKILGTGWAHCDAPDVSKFIGTVQFVENGRPLVFHLFDIAEEVMDA